MAARSEAWVCYRTSAGIAGSIPARGHGCLSVVSVVCCQVEVRADLSSRGVSLTVVRRYV